MISNWSFFEEKDGGHPLPVIMVFLKNSFHSTSNPKENNQKRHALNIIDFNTGQKI